MQNIWNIRMVGIKTDMKSKFLLMPLKTVKLKQLFMSIDYIYKKCY